MARRKLFSSVLTVFLFIGILGFSALSSAQQFNHIIIIVQENRTPDNLFGASGLPGADVQIRPNIGKAVPLSGGPDPGHAYSNFVAEAGGIYNNDFYDYVTSEVDPYWQLAAQYGFANRMFQTNQGPSYPAHLFLVLGTSAPSNTSLDFVSSNIISGGADCKAPRGSIVDVIHPDGTFGTTFPCFTTSSLLDLLGAKGLTWRYYLALGHTIWNPPGSLKPYVKSPNIIGNPPQVLTDIAKGHLANVSWVTPASTYSDHPGTGYSGGPKWVASIVNAVGQSPYWNDTAILVTWDDWGGFWDHVPPLANNTGWCMQYCYGFRVPLLVISAKTPAGYVDNGVHDFGSILHFVESNFGLGHIGPGGWADAWADDLSAFFVHGMNRPFVKVNALKMTKKELADQSDPDDDREESSGVDLK